MVRVQLLGLLAPCALDLLAYHRKGLLEATALSTLRKSVVVNCQNRAREGEEKRRVREKADRGEEAR